MCGRQRPSINMTLFSLSAIRDTWKTKELINDDRGELCGMVPIVHALDPDTSLLQIHIQNYTLQ